MIFFYGLERLQQIPFVPRFLISYLQFKDMRDTVPAEGKEWQLDSGGYTVGVKNKLETPFAHDYPFYVETYADFINRQKPTVAWTMDASIKYPFSKDIIKKKQEITNENTGKLIDYTGKRIGNILQGWDIEDYHQHIDMMKESGTLTDWIGMSVTQAHANKYFARDMVVQVAKRLPGGTKLHALAFKFALLKPFPVLTQILHSSDSANWINLTNYKIPSGIQTGALVDFVNKMEDFLGSVTEKKDIFHYW